MNPADYYNVITTGGGDDDPDSVYFCNYCLTKLFYRETDKDTGKRIFLCTKCTIEYIPANQKVRKAAKFETPQGPASDILIATQDNPNKEVSSTNYAKTTLPRVWKALEKSGFKFVDYSEIKIKTAGGSTLQRRYRWRETWRVEPRPTLQLCVHIFCVTLTSFYTGFRP